MGIETNTEVERLKDVSDGEGGVTQPANRDEQTKTNERLGNQDSVTAFSHSTSGTTAESLESHPVPDGFKVVVTYDESNSGNVYVGGPDAQPVPLTGVGQAIEMRVTDTSEIYIRTPTGGDGVGVLFEG